MMKLKALKIFSASIGFKLICFLLFEQKNNIKSALTFEGEYLIVIPHLGLFEWASEPCH